MSLVGLAFGALIFCLLIHYGSITVDWTRTKDFTEGLANLTQSLALIGGGVGLISNLLKEGLSRID